MDELEKGIVEKYQKNKTGITNLLTETERDVFELRFGLKNGKEHNFEEIHGMFLKTTFSREHIRQILEKVKKIITGFETTK